MLTLDIRNDSGTAAPDASLLRAAVEAALAVGGVREAVELSLCIVDRDTMRSLNGRYRHRDRPTNVLSFPADLPPGLPLRHLGDIVACAPVILAEARQQDRPAEAHWSHMLVHGTLHLLGHDHEREDEAQRMEALETRALAALGWPCPYRGDEAPASTLAMAP